MKANLIPFLLFIIVAIVVIAETSGAAKKQQDVTRQMMAYRASQPKDTVWWGWNKYQIPNWNDSGKLIEYGYELISNTAHYLGPKGTVLQISNGMNCQNCHLNGGIVPFGNNFGKVYATYPLFRARNNGIQSIYDRVNDCLERSLNGKTLDSNTREMKAIYAYMQWLCDGIPKGVTRGGTGIMKLKYLNRAADPVKGSEVYTAKCQSCHGDNGQGQPSMDARGYTYPPLWGPHSYNDGAGLFRITNFAGFVKNNMPFGADYHNTQLTDEEAWDVAAFVNSRPRPHMDQSNDWKNIDKKPIDYPFGPYTDSFSENQHKYGPFEPIRTARNSSKL